MSATATPMFPLGSVLFPHMPLPLRLFESRYLKMLARLLDEPDPQFGVVLIERGQEVGGGDQRFALGTMARVVRVQAQEGFMAVVAVGTGRFRVAAWLAEEPYPLAEVEPLPDLRWAQGLQSARDEAERLVREALSMTRELPAVALDFDLAEDPLTACWQLAALTPVGELDHLRLLGAESVPELLDLIRRLAGDAVEARRFGEGD
ncbi:MAG TPA: LON peptidase substrate-binding domain-containing protein [Actinomycetota bacterium]|nr:LON peptidase substrate-binding domain-containing protein [Actinomycetota bacterium]